MHDTGLLTQTVLLFGAAVAVAWLFRLLRAPAVIGFLVAGMLIGPAGLRLISQERVGQFADLGIVMLLFTVGLELSPEPLVRSGRRLVGAFVFQMALTIGVAWLVARMGLKMSAAASLIIAVGVAMSSTAIVLSQLSERRETDTPAGTIITGVLLLQDVFVIAFMLFLPLLGMGEGDWRVSGLRGLAALAGLTLVTLGVRRWLPLVLKQLLDRGGRELTPLFAVLAACAGAWLSGLAGWSPALGACVAGLLLSQTELRHQIFAEIVPFRDVLNALFFISMGMLVDLKVVVEFLPIVGTAIVGTLVLKAVLTSTAVALAGWPARLAIHAGLGLATVSEFSFMLAREAGQLGILPEKTLSEFVAYSVGTMMLGALLVPVAGRAAIVFGGVIRRKAADDGGSTGSGRMDLEQHVIIVGFGLNGRNLARVLKTIHIPCCIVELNQSLVALAREAGYPSIVGDATRPAILHHAGLDTARAVVVTINDVQATRRIVVQARASQNDMYILARTRYVSELEELFRLGANEVIPEEFETSIEIFSHVLHHFAVPENIIEAQISAIRAGHYGLLRGLPTTHAHRAEVLRLLELTATKSFMIEEDSPARGRTIRELDLRAKSGVTIIAVVRQGRPTASPPPEMTMEPGDILVLVGAHKQLEAAKAQLRAPATGGTAAAVQARH